MDIKFIDMEDNATAIDADSMDQWNAEGMPADTSRQFFARLGNVSGGALTNLPITITGKHSDRITIAFKEFGAFSESLILDSLAKDKSQNLYITLSMPTTVADESVTNYLNVGSDSLAITYESSRAITTLFNPYPLWEGQRTDTIFATFVGKPVHRFFRFDPVNNPNGPNPQATAGKFILKHFDLCEYLNSNNRQVGYEEPIFGDINCIPTPREVASPSEWEPLSADDYSYEDRANIFLPADFLNQLGNEPPKWTHFATESNPAPDGLARLTVDTDGLERFKRTHFLMEREGTLYHLEHLRPVMQGQQLVYYKAELRLLQEPSAGNPKGYNPFAQVYDEDSNRIVTRYSCWNAPTLKALGGSGTGSNLGS
jgi:hypothetical protein